MKYYKHFETVDGTDRVKNFQPEDRPGTYIPESSGNRDYVRMMKAVEAGEAEIVEVDDTLPVDDTPTPAEEIAALRKAVRGDMTDLEALDARR